MIETRKAHEFDIIELTEDLPAYSAKFGERGTVVEVFDAPEEAYMVEFVDESGTSSRIADWVTPGQFRNITWLANESVGRGITLYNAGKFEEAERNLKIAIDLSPQCKASIRTTIQRDFVDRGDWKGAIHPLRMLVRLDPSDTDSKDSLAIAWINFGIHEADAGRPESAALCFKRAIALGHSTDVLSHALDNLSVTYSDLAIKEHAGGDAEQAQFYMSAAFEISPSESARHNLGVANVFLADVCIRKGEFPRAIFFFEAAEEVGLTSPELLNNYGVALAYVGRFNEAERSFKEAAELKPGDTIILRNLSQLRQFAPTSDFFIEEVKAQFIPMPPPREYGIAA